MIKMIWNGILEIRKKKKIPTTKQRVAQYIDQVISFTSSSFSRPFLFILFYSDVFLEKYFSRRSSCAQWTTAAWCPRSSGSTPPRTTSPSPWSRCCLLVKILLTMNLLMIFLTIHYMITISCTDGGLSRRPSHPLDPIRASLTLWNLLLCCGECPWTGNFLRDKD